MTRDPIRIASLILAAALTLGVLVNLVTYPPG
jgi:hypothetical protein